LSFLVGFFSTSESGSLSGSASTFFSGDLAFSFDLFLFGVLDLDFFDLPFLITTGSGSGSASFSEDLSDLAFLDTAFSDF
jgi:hypothetical protein